MDPATPNLGLSTIGIVSRLEQDHYGTAQRRVGALRQLSFAQDTHECKDDHGGGETGQMEASCSGMAAAMVGVVLVTISVHGSPP